MKRFWKEAAVVEAPGGWTVHLDGRPVRTPAREEIVVPRRAMADEIASEWDAQESVVSPLSMPMTRTAATCLDRVAPDIEAIRETIAAYGETDLLCYRAEGPATLTERQAEAWDPLLDWAAQALDARLSVGAGVMHIAQPSPVVAALARPLRGLDAWEMTGMSELTTISGSLVLALAVHAGHLPAHKAWTLSRIDELWNIEQWGEDHEAAQQAARREADFLQAARVLELLKSGADG